MAVRGTPVLPGSPVRVGATEWGKSALAMALGRWVRDEGGTPQALVGGRVLVLRAWRWVAAEEQRQVEAQMAPR